jgi:7-cyano-7-deazaguanine synthase
VSLVTLVSGGLDSSLVSLLAKEEAIEQFPLFVDYGQICKEQEWKACCAVNRKLALPKPTRINLGGYGRRIASGLTNRKMRVFEDAFLPGRNLLFLLAGSAYACQMGASGVAMGLLSEEFHLFPDQTSEFTTKAQVLLSFAMGRDIKIVTPLMAFSKREVLAIAKMKGIVGTYSCHAGTRKPCGKCVSCLEVKKAN